MLTKKIITSVSGALLITTVISLVNLNSINLGQFVSAQTNTINTDPKLAEITLNQNSPFARPPSYISRDYAISATTDMNEEGNQVSAWVYDENISVDPTINCHGIRYQRYNKIGQPMSGPINVVQSCEDNSATNVTGYFDPDIKITNNLNIIVAWTTAPEDNLNTISSGNVQLAVYNANDQLNGSYWSVNEDGNSVNQEANIKIAVNKAAYKEGETETNLNFAIVWYNKYINTTPGQRKALVQAFHIDLSNPTNEIQKNGNNQIYNLNSDVSDRDESNVAIAFSKDRYLLSWIGSTPEGNSAALARTMQLDGQLDNNVFEISSHNSTDLSAAQITLAGTPRTFNSNISNIYYGAWTQSKGTILEGVNQDIMLRKITCDQSATPVCNTTTKENNEKITVRANTSTNQDQYFPSIAVSQNKNDTTKLYNNEKTASDYLNVAWVQTTIPYCPPTTDCGLPTLDAKSQLFNNNLAKLGSERSISNTNRGRFEDPRGATTQQKVHTAMSSDGEFAVTHVEGPKLISSLYRSEYQKIGTEKLLHTPDTNIQTNPSIAMSNDGTHIVAYDYDNTDIGNTDVVFAIYDKDGNAIKNNTIATSYQDALQSNPSVAYFTDPVGSTNHGKFIIAWNGWGSPTDFGTYYRIFNSDGTPETGDIQVNNGIDYPVSPSVSAGKYNQFIITYGTFSGPGSQISYEYHNDSTIISGKVNTDDGSLNSLRPKVFLNPEANNNSINSSQFVITWENNTPSVHIREGHLTSSNTVSFNTINTSNDSEITISNPSTSPRISGANLPFLTNINTAPSNTARNPFMYALTWTEDGSGFNNKAMLAAYTFGQGLLNDPTIVNKSIYKNTLDPQISVDKATGNILIGWINNILLTNITNFNKVLYLDNQKALDFAINDGIIGNNSTFARITNGDGLILGTTGKGNYLNIDGVQGTTLTTSNNIRRVNSATIFQANPIIVPGNQTLQYVGNNYTNLGFGLTVNQYSPTQASGTISSSTPNELNLTNVTGTFTNDSQIYISDQAGTVETAPIDNPLITRIDLLNNSGLSYMDGPHILFDIDTGATATLVTAFEGYLDVNNIANGVFNNNDHFVMVDTTTYPIISPTIGEASGQLYRLLVASDNSNTTIEPFGPNFRANSLGNGNEYIYPLAIGYDSSSSDTNGHYEVFSYTTSSAFSYDDNNGVYSQLFKDPFTAGQNQDLNPLTTQQIAPGGKYIVVPPLLDFGDIRKNSTKKLDIGSLTPGYFEVTDLDGSIFDLTVSITDLTNSLDAGQIIPKANFSIENNNGIDPLVSTPYSNFTNTNDVQLDPSTNPNVEGSRASLATPQTLLKKNTNHPGVFRIVPNTYLKIDPSATSGIYSGTLTLTLT